MADKISRLKSLQKKLERRLGTIAKKGAISIVSQGCGDTNKPPEKIILLGSGSGILIYSPITGQVFEQEEAGNLPTQEEPMEPPSDPHEPTNSAHSHAHPNLLGVAVENEVSSSVGATKRNKTIEEFRSGAESSGNPDSRYTWHGTQTRTPGCQLAQVGTTTICPLQFLRNSLLIAQNK